VAYFKILCWPSSEGEDVQKVTELPDLILRVLTDSRAGHSAIMFWPTPIHVSLTSHARLPCIADAHNVMLCSCLPKLFPSLH
jgi:hypothetical protein